jgi:hypothetical protein
MRAPTSSLLWKSAGRILSHSKLVLICRLQIMLRCLTKASHKINIKYKTPTKEIIDPIDDTTFQVM